MGLGPLQQQPLQVPDLLVAEPGLRTGVGLSGQGRGDPLGHGEPAIQRGAADAEDAGDDGGRLAPLHQFHGPSASAFEFFGGSNRSHILTTTGTTQMSLWPDWSQ